jgi:MFS family permease
MPTDSLGSPDTEPRVRVTNTPAAAKLSAARTGLLLAVVCAVIFYDALDLSITQIALPSIQTSLRVSTATLPWIAAAYVVTYGGFLLLGGRMTDLLGSRRVFLAGLTVFGAASLACGLADSTVALVVARAVQGVGAALTVPAAVAILAGTFADERARTRAFGIFAAAGASGFTAGLVLGGLITGGLSWRWIFLAKVPAVVMTLVAAAWLLPSYRPTGRRPGYDVAGGVTVTAGAVLLMYAINRAGMPGVEPGEVAVPGIAGLVIAAVFFSIERRTTAPLLPLRLLRLRTLTATDAAALTVLAAPFGVSYVVTMYLQGALHRSPWQAALTLLPGAVGSALVSRYLAPALLHRLGLRAVYGGGLLVVTAGDALLLCLTSERATWLVIIAGLVSLALGMGLAYPAATFGGVEGVAQADQGAAAGLNNTALQIGGGLGLAVVATAVTAGLHGASPATAGAAEGVYAARLGGAAATVLPLLGAVIVLVALPARRRLDGSP